MTGVKDVGWTDWLVSGCTALAGPTAGLVLYCLIVAEAIMVVVAPPLVLLVSFRLMRARQEMRSLRTDLEQSVVRIHGAIGGLSGELARLRGEMTGAILSVRPAFRPSPVPAASEAGSAGPGGQVEEAGGGDAGSRLDEEAVSPAGEVAYRFCPACRSIQLVKYSRCQACGYHFL